MSPRTSAGDLRSRLVFGTAAIGMPYGLPRVGATASEAPSLEAVHALIERALDLGITTFDTAPAYGDSEKRLGEALRDRGEVWTKVTSGSPVVSLEASLRSLQRPRVELLQWHNWTAALGADPKWRDEWTSLRSDHRALALGATTYGVADALAAVASGHFDVVQVECNLVNQGVVNAIANAETDRAVSVAVRSVYLQGALTDEGRSLPDRPALHQGVARARTLAGTLGVSLTQLALRFALEHPAIKHVIVGFDRPAQLEQACHIAGSSLALPLDSKGKIEALDLRGDPAADPRNWR